MTYEIIKTNLGNQILTSDGTYLRGYDYHIYPIIEGKRLIMIFNKYTFINKNDTIILDNQIWYNFADHYHNGVALIFINSKYNFINYNGDLIFQEYWFDAVGDFVRSYTKALINNKWAIIDNKGYILTDFIFDHICIYPTVIKENQNDIGTVTLYGKQYIINNKIELE